MIEVLVSIVILSFGLLGMVGLQAAALQTNRDARLQSSAVTLARELAEIMRGNKDVALLTTGNPYLVTTSTPLVPPTANYCLKVGSTCGSALLAGQAEMTDWLERVDAELPGAKVTVCRDTAPYNGTGTDVGLPTWNCTPVNANDPIVIKIGWTRASLKAATASETAASKPPSVMLSVTPGYVQ